MKPRTRYIVSLELIAVYGVSIMLNAVLSALVWHDYHPETAVIVTVGYYVMKHRL